MDDAQFKELCTEMKIGKSLTYQDFLDHFQRQNNAEYSEKMRTSWVIFNLFFIGRQKQSYLITCFYYQAPKIVAGAPVQPMTCAEGMALLNTKIQNSYRNVRGAFHAMDRDSDGLVNRTDLVALLTNLLIPMKREDINELWAKISDGMSSQKECCYECRA